MWLKCFFSSSNPNYKSVLCINKSDWNKNVLKNCEIAPPKILLIVSFLNCIPQFLANWNSKNPDMLSDEINHVAFFVEELGWRIITV